MDQTITKFSTSSLDITKNNYAQIPTLLHENVFNSGSADLQFQALITSCVIYIYELKCFSCDLGMLVCLSQLSGNRGWGCRGTIKLFHFLLHTHTSMHSHCTNTRSKKETLKWWLEIYYLYMYKMTEHHMRNDTWNYIKQYYPVPTIPYTFFQW